jgi:hypothetical protein
VRRKFRDAICQGARDDGTECRGGAIRLSGYRLCPRCSVKAGLIPADVAALWWSSGGRRSRMRPTQPTAADPDFSSPRRIRKVCEVVAGRVMRGELDERLADRVVALGELARRTFSDDLLQKLEQLEEVLRHTPGPASVIVSPAPRALR